MVGGSPGGLKLSKLDRFLVSHDLLEIYSDLIVVDLDRYFADHCPILLKTTKLDFGPTPFRFFNQCFRQMDPVS